MTARPLLLLWTVVLLIPTATVPAAAAPVVIYSETDYGDIYFDLTPGGVATFMTDLIDVQATSPLGYLAIDYTIEGWSGPLVSVVPYRGGPGADYDEYTYGPGGGLLMDFTFELPDGTPHTMFLRGGLPTMLVTARDTSGEITIAPFPVTIESGQRRAVRLEAGQRPICVRDLRGILCGLQLRRFRGEPAHRQKFGHIDDHRSRRP